MASTSLALLPSAVLDVALADLAAGVHTGNIGQIVAADYARPVWAITDPGHMVPTAARWLDLTVETL